MMANPPLPGIRHRVREKGGKYELQWSIAPVRWWQRRQWWYLTSYTDKREALVGFMALARGL